MGGSVSPLRDVISPKLEPEEMIVIDVNRRIVQNGRVLALGKASGSSSSCSSSSDSFTSVSNRHPINSPLISYQPVKFYRNYVNILLNYRNTLLHITEDCKNNN